MKQTIAFLAFVWAHSNLQAQWPWGYVNISSAQYPTENYVADTMNFIYVRDTGVLQEGDGIHEPHDLSSIPFRLAPATPTVTGLMSNDDKVLLNSVPDSLAAHRAAINSGTTWSFNNFPGRTIQTVAAAGNGWQVSSTRPADVSYSVTIGTTVSLSGNSTGYVVLEIASTNSSTAGNWTEIARVASGQSGTLVIGLTLNQTGGGCLSGSIPAGYYVRVRSVNTAGTPSYTMNSGQEVTK